jgi:8-oxo-dGTP diphosphatase
LATAYRGGVRGDGDGWVRCGLGHRHWGRHGAAGLLLRHVDGGTVRVLLQHRADWSHHGGTWGLLGGAVDSHENAVQAALREAHEEAALDADALAVIGWSRDEHIGWAYTSVVAEASERRHVEPANLESRELRWVALNDTDDLPLHPGFADSWPRLRECLQPLRLVVDGANVVGSRPDGWWRDRLGANRRLRDGLEALARAGLPTPDGGLDVVLPAIELVVEGKARPLAGEESEDTQQAQQPRVAVISAPGEGDDTITSLAPRRRDERVVVVTADRELRSRVSDVGATCMGPGELLAAVDSAVAATATAQAP